MQMTDEQVVIELDDIYKLIRPKNKFSSSGAETGRSSSQFMKTFDSVKKEEQVLNQKRYQLRPNFKSIERILFNFLIY